jgi:hypothetical protein
MIVLIFNRVYGSFKVSTRFLEQHMPEVKPNLSSPAAPEAAPEKWVPPARPTDWQVALLILHLVQTREAEFQEKRPKRKISRARISQNTMRKLCGRSQISNDFLIQLQEALLSAGWALFCIGPTHYAIIKLESVRGWSRISSKRIDHDLNAVRSGTFKWEEKKQLLMPTQPDHDGDEQNETDGESDEPE